MTRVLLTQSQQLGNVYRISLSDMAASAAPQLACSDRTARKEFYLQVLKIGVGDFRGVEG